MDELAHAQDTVPRCHCAVRALVPAHANAEAVCGEGRWAPLT